MQILIKPFVFILSFFTLPLRHLTHGQVTTNEKISWFLHACGLLSGDLVYYQAYGNVLSSGKLSVKSLPSYTLRDGRRVTLCSGRFDFWEPKVSNWADSGLLSYLLRLICLSFFNWYGWNPWSIYSLISLFFWARIIAWGQAIFKCGKVDKLPFYILKCWEIEFDLVFIWWFYEGNLPNFLWILQVEDL